MLHGLKAAGCRIIHAPSPTTAPFRITFEAPDGERIGIIAYAFLASNRATKNRPGNEHRFQIKDGSKQVTAAPAGSKPKQHELWQDPYGLYTTVLVGINPDRANSLCALCIVLHNPTKFFISLEFKEAEAEQITQTGWFAWERDRFSDEDPVEVLAGGDARELPSLHPFGAGGTGRGSRPPHAACGAADSHASRRSRAAGRCSRGALPHRQQPTFMPWLSSSSCPSMKC